MDSSPRLRRLLAVSLLVAACAGSLAGTARAQDPTSDAVGAVVGFSPANEASFVSLEDAIDGGGVRLAALRPHLAASSLNRRWAAAYVAHSLATTEADYRLLAGRLDDRDPSVRALLAFALLSGGKTEAIPVLIRLLSVPQYLLNSEPLVPIADLAAWRLERLTGAGIGFDAAAGPEARRRAAARWLDWWGKVRSRIRWDAGANRFRWPGSATARRLSLPSVGSRFVGTVPAGPVHGTGAVLDGERVTITVQIELVFPEGLSRKLRRAATRAAERAERFLDGPGRTGTCVEVDFALDVRTREVGEPFTDGYHQLTVVVGVENEELASGRYRRSHIDGPRPRPGVEIGTGELTTGGIEQYGERLVGHEVAHLLDLGDEYLRDANGKYVYPLDPDSFLGDGRSGEVLQRHLDFLVQRLVDEAALDCEKWKLDIQPWTTKLDPYVSGDTHLIGRVSRASISARFWANPRTGRITPAGDAPCGMLNLTRPCDGIGGPQTRRGGNTVLSELRAVKGSASCSSVSFTAVRTRFTTTVTGRRRENELRLVLDVPDEEVVRYVCQPPARYDPNKSDISAGMDVAGALDFTITLEGGRSGSRSFRYDDEHDHAFGTARVTRLE